jgi:serine phosphatase RsbU (regulator of sigma subunit)
VLAQTNAILRRRLPNEVELVTAFLGVIEGGVLRYANAGHVPPLVVAAGPEFDAAPHELRTTGLPLGIEDDITFQTRELPFAGRSLLFASTDGLVEARRGSELFGQERVSELVAAHAALLSPQALVEHAYAAAETFADALTDDVAIIALRPN